MDDIWDDFFSVRDEVLPEELYYIFFRKFRDDDFDMHIPVFLIITMVSKNRWDNLLWTIDRFSSPDTDLMITDFHPIQDEILFGMRCQNLFELTDGLLEFEFEVTEEFYFWFCSEWMSNDTTQSLHKKLG